jgi:hypothetical protein
MTARKVASLEVCQGTTNTLEFPRKDEDILVIDTGGGMNATITKRAWKILHRTNHQTAMVGYQDKGSPQICEIVNAVTKATILGRDLPVLLLMNYATMLNDDQEKESLCVPFQSMKHGISFDLTPTSFGGKGGMKVDNEFIPFKYDNEKLYLNISKPTSEDLDMLEWFELSSPYPTMVDNIQRTKKITSNEDIPLIEWKKRLALVPDEVIKRTLEATTQYYLTTEAETRQDPRRHL